ncbi:MAG: helix-turn-helix domain-containing protein [Thermoguttaceae bacterium]|jgi:excisionase family DNA binding protein
MKTTRQLIRFLAEQAAILSDFAELGPPIDYPEGPEGEYYLSVECTQIVETCQREAAKFGCDLICEKAGEIGPKEALVQVGKILAWTQAMAQSKSDMLTVKQAAEHWNVSQRTIYDLIECGRLRCQRIGKGRGTIRVKSTDLDRCVIEPTAKTYKHLTI